MKLSACLIVRNEASEIEACLETLRDADEIVAVDTGSEDDTEARICRWTSATERAAGRHPHRLSLLDSSANFRYHHPMAPTNFIDPSANLHPSVKVWHFAIILSDVTIGEGTVIGSRAEIGRGCLIGRNCRIGSGVFLPPNAVIGDGVFIGPNTTFTDDKFPKAGNANYKAQPPIVREGASIGAGAVILPGIVIGAGALVGAGAVVSHDVGDDVVVQGVPARAVGFTGP